MGGGHRVGGGGRRRRRAGAGPRLRHDRAAAAAVRPRPEGPRAVPVDPHQPPHPAGRLVHADPRDRAVPPLHAGRPRRGDAARHPVQELPGVARRAGPRRRRGGVAPRPRRRRRAEPRRPGGRRPRARATEADRHRPRRADDPAPHPRGPPPRRHAEHRPAGRLGARPRPPARPRRRGVRLDRVRPPAGTARHRADDRPVHQHAARPRPLPDGRAARRPHGAPPGRADRTPRPPPPRPHRHPARGGTRWRRPVRHDDRAGELPVRPRLDGRVPQRRPHLRGRLLRRDPLPAVVRGPARRAAVAAPALPARRVRAGGRGGGPRPDPPRPGGVRRGLRPPDRRRGPRGRRRPVPAGAVERHGRRHPVRHAPGPLRVPGRADPVRRGPRLRRHPADVRGAERARQPSGPRADRAGDRPRGPCGHRPAAHARDRRGGPRRAEGGRGLRSDRPRVPVRPHRLHAVRRPARPHDHRRRLPGCDRAARARPVRRRAGPGAAPGQRRVRHLHVRVHRAAQGRDRSACRRAQLLRGAPGRVHRPGDRSRRRAADAVRAPGVVLVRHVVDGPAVDDVRPRAAPHRRRHAPRRRGVHRVRGARADRPREHDPVALRGAPRSGPAGRRRAPPALAPPARRRGRR
ncbi:Uncharacterised protein [Mycobacterium tuberculosis]|nr:Uncharacterised protein [Mycobacterium tuberculosis]